MKPRVVPARKSGMSLVAGVLIAMSVSAQSLISTTILSPPGITNRVGFDFEVAVVHSTGLVYVGATAAYGDEVGVIDPNTNVLAAAIPLSTSGALDFSVVNQTTGLVYFRQRPVGTIVVIDARPSSATFNQALAPFTLAGRQIQSFALDESRGLLYVTNNSTSGPLQSRVSIVDINPANPAFHQVLDEVLLPPNGLARGVAVNTVTNKIYLGVSGGGVGGVYVLDGATASLSLIAGSGGPTLGVVVNQSANLIYATRTGNQLVAVDGAANTALAIIPMPGLISVAGFDERLAVNTGTGRVYVQTSEASTSSMLIVVDGDRFSPTFNTVLATINIGRNGISPVVDQSLNRVVAASFLDKRTTIIDGSTNAVIATVPSTQTPSDVVIDPATHRAYVANQMNFVQKIDLSGGMPTATIVTGAEAGLGVVNPNNHLFYVGVTVATTEVRFFDECGAGGTVAALPHGSGRYVFSAINRNTNRIYSVNSSANLAGDLSSLPGFVSVIDGNSNAVIANIEVGNQPFGIGVNEATNKIFVVNAGFGIDFPSGITVIDGSSNTTTNADTSAFPPGSTFILNVVANEATNKMYFQVNTGGQLNIGVLNGATNVATPLPATLGPVSAIAVNKTLNRVYVVSESTGFLHVLDGATDMEIATIPTGSPSPGFDNIAVNESTGRVYVSNTADDTLIAIDGASNAIVATIPVGDGPRSVAVNALTNRIYVGNDNDKTISFIDGGSLTVAATLALPLSPGDLAVDAAVSRIYAAGGNDQIGVMVISDDSPQLTALGPAHVWIGLKNSDDVGTKFDLLAEVFKNGALIGSGQINGVSGGSSGFNNAVLRTINLALSSPVNVSPGDTLSFRLSVRIAVGVAGHRSGTARLWFNDAAANSRFDATIGCATNGYFQLDGFTLGASAGPGPKKTIDVFVDRAASGNSFKPFGTWSKTF